MKKNSTGYSRSTLKINVACAQTQEHIRWKLLPVAVLLLDDLFLRNVLTESQAIQASILPPQWAYYVILKNSPFETPALLLEHTINFPCQSVVVNSPETAVLGPHRDNSLFTPCIERFRNKVSGISVVKPYFYARLKSREITPLRERLVTWSPSIAWTIKSIHQLWEENQTESKDFEIGMHLCAKIEIADFVATPWNTINCVTWHAYWHFPKRHFCIRQVYSGQTTCRAMQRRPYFYSKLQLLKNVCNSATGSFLLNLYRSCISDKGKFKTFYLDKLTYPTPRCLLINSQPKIRVTITVDQGNLNWKETHVICHAVLVKLSINLWQGGKFNHNF